MSGFYATCVNQCDVLQVDLPLAMVERTRQWIQEHKDEPLLPKLR